MLLKDVPEQKKKRSIYIALVLKSRNKKLHSKPVDCEYVCGVLILSYRHHRPHTKSTYICVCVFLSNSTTSVCDCFALRCVRCRKAHLSLYTRAWHSFLRVCLTNKAKRQEREKESR